MLALQPAARRARLLPSVLAGLGLAVAWQCTRMAVPMWLALLPLSGALLAHVVDLRGRW